METATIGITEQTYKQAGLELEAEQIMSIPHKFSIPYTKGMIEALPSLDIESISDIYFSDNKFGSARSIFNGTEMFEELYAIREKYGIKMH